MNSNKLRGKIAEHQYTIKSLADAIGVNQATMHRKIKGEYDFSTTEVGKMVKLLDLSPYDVVAIFFSP